MVNAGAGKMALQVCIKKKMGRFLLNAAFTADRQCLGILGASGCGKSMLLKCIAGIETPDEGYIVLDGTVLFDSEKKISLPPQKRHIGYLFQNYALFPSMTVAENIGVAVAEGCLKNRRKSRKEQKEALQREIERQICLFQLEGLENHYPSQLSGGQQQRVALARMMAAKPSVILLDEPFSALDSYLKEAMQREMAAVIRQFGGNVVMVSHSRDEIYKLCPKLAVMDEGHILCVNATKAVFENPVYVQAARLTGCKNISPVRKISDYCVEALDWGITLKTAVKVTDEITHIGIRAHDWLRSDGKGERVNEFSARLVEIIEAPFEVQYFIRCTDAPESQPVWWKTDRQHPYGEIQSESRIFAAIEPEKIMLLKSE